MAVVVEISKTAHLAYSPLNEKHNILYHRARHNVNQRHIQKPWFDLNPFLEKDDDKGLDLNNYRPENDRGVMPLESLTIVEDYFSDKPLLTNEFKIGEFWDFLFSDEWSDGYSVRVLEGRLMNLIATTLVSMTQSRQVVQHSTVAFAKNRRQRFSVYKHAEKEPELGRYEETLLLEFIYYGHATEHGIGEPDGSSAVYPETTTTYSTVTNFRSSDLEFSDQDTLSTSSVLTPTTSTGSYDSGPVKPPCGQPSSNRQRLLKKRVTLSRETFGNQASSTSTRPPINPSVSRVQEVGNAHAQIPRGSMTNLFCSSMNSSGSEAEYPKHPAMKIDLNKFMCTEKVSYLGEFDLSDDSSCSSDDDDDTVDYGQEYYLGDRSKSQEGWHSVQDKLKKRKDIVKQQREIRRKQLEEHQPPKPIFPEFSELNVAKYLPKDDTKNELQRPSEEKVPDLDEYARILKRDERNDPRFSKAKQLKRILRKKKMIAPKNESFADTVGGVTDSQACRLHCYNRDNTWKVMGETAKRNFLIKKLLIAGGKVQVKPKKTVPKEKKMKKKLEIPLIYITTQSNITYLHPISKQMIQNKRREQQELLEKERQAQIPKRRMSLVPPSPTALVAELKKRRATLATGEEKVKPQSTTAKDSKGPGFPKAKLLTGMESPDFDSEEEEIDDLDESHFDTHKLKLRYSLERIRRCKAARTRKTKEIPNVFKVLRKFYRMQAIFKAFTPGRRRSSVTSKLSKRGGNRKVRQLSNNMDETLEEEDPITIGKMKWFQFLDAKRKIMPPEDEDINEQYFENFPMHLFRENVGRALHEFVVRREVVISDNNAKASVSITFTKKNVFTQSKK